MKKQKIVLKEPINVIYEGRVLDVVVRVFEIHLYRSGKPATVWGKDIKNPQHQAAPYNFEYLDVESKERINDIIVNSGLPVITSDE
jgi:hypothetical protein